MSEARYILALMASIVVLGPAAVMAGSLLHTLVRGLP